MNRICLIFNPTAKGDKAQKFSRRIASLAAGAILKPTTSAGDGRRLARLAVEEGFGTIVAVGGDGTISEVVNGMGDSCNGFSMARLGIMPLGTANVFARELGIPFQPEAAWGVIESGHERTVDLVLAEYQVKKNQERKFMVQLGGAGLDARAVELLDYRHKRFCGYLAYVISGLKALVERKPLISITNGHSQRQGELIVLGNGRFYGGQFKLFPNASATDGKLDATIFPKANFPTLFKSGWDMLRGRWLGMGGSSALQSDRFILTPEHNAQVPLELDGDLVGHLPATFTCCPKQLRVICPR